MAKVHLDHVEKVYQGGVKAVKDFTVCPIMSRAHIFDKKTGRNLTASAIERSTTTRPVHSME